MARILISMPEDFLNKIDLVADGENRSRSGPSHISITKY